MASDRPVTERKSRLLGAGEINVSFEFFPPKNEKMEDALWASIHRLAPLHPEFVSVTYGAGGSTRERTHNTVSRIAGGVGTKYEPHPGGYANAAELVAGLKKIGNFEISVAGYPEKHPESLSVDADLANLKAKVDAGADRVITQFGFDNAHYLRYLERARAAGIWVPIMPGIVPIHNYKQVAGFATRAGATVPAWITRRFEGLENDSGTSHLVAAAVATEQVMDLVDEGMRHFHFYSLNRPDLVYAICHLLGVRPGVGGAQEQAA